MILMESAEAIVNSPFFVWMLDLLRSIAELRTPLLTAIMSAVTYLGHEMVFLVIAMILVWCVDKRYGYRFLAVFMIGSFLQQALKAAFMIPRPWILDPTFRSLVVENAIEAASGYSFPSGHTLTAFVTLGGLAAYLRKKWAYAAAAVLTLLVAFSRMYLGVHTLLDVVVGFLLGAAVLVFFGLLFRKEANQERKLNILLLIGCTACVALLVYLLVCPLPENASYIPMAMESIDNAYVLVGAAVGMVIGKLIDDRFVRFETKGVWWVQVLKILIGFVLVLGLRIGLKKLFGGNNEPPVLHGLRYLLMTAAAIGVYPLLFKVLNRIGTNKEKA